MFRQVMSFVILSATFMAAPALAQDDDFATPTISPTHGIATGHAPGMQAKLVKSGKDEDVYAIIFKKDDDVMSGLTDFIKARKVADAHFTAIGATSGGVLGYLDLAQKVYIPIRVTEQVEVLSLIGDVATFNGQPGIHMHAVLGRRDGSTVGGHVWKLIANPTLEVFMTVDKTPLAKRTDSASGMRMIDPAQ